MWNHYLIRVAIVFGAFAEVMKPCKIFCKTACGMHVKCIHGVYSTEKLCVALPNGGHLQPLKYSTAADCRNPVYIFLPKKNRQCAALWEENILVEVLSFLRIWIVSHLCNITKKRPTRQCFGSAKIFEQPIDFYAKYHIMKSFMKSHIEHWIEHYIKQESYIDQFDALFSPYSLPKVPSFGARHLFSKWIEWCES